MGKQIKEFEKLERDEDYLLIGVILIIVFLLLLFVFWFVVNFVNVNKELYIKNYEKPNHINRVIYNLSNATCIVRDNKIWCSRYSGATP